MANMKGKILILVEGARTDVKLMRHLMHVYKIDNRHQIVSYNTNIYSLYQEMFASGDPESIDLLQLLKEKEMDADKKQIFDEVYSDILLIFDLDPQDPLFSVEKIQQMFNYFVESSDMGKLYLNYPMVEAFYHMKTIPDAEYMTYFCNMDELHRGTYKQRVNRENRNHDYTKFAVNRFECSLVITQNIEKAKYITGWQGNGDNGALPHGKDILQSQILQMQNNNRVFVLCTCVFFVYDYNPKLLDWLV